MNKSFSVIDLAAVRWLIQILVGKRKSQKKLLKIGTSTNHTKVKIIQIHRQHDTERRKKRTLPSA